MQKPAHYLLLIYLSWIGLLVFAAVVACDRGLVDLLLASDRSRISLLIGLLYVSGTLYCARRIVFVSTQLTLAEHGETLIRGSDGAPSVSAQQVTRSDGACLPEGFLANYVSDVLRVGANKIDRTCARTGQLT